MIETSVSIYFSITDGQGAQARDDAC
uniref:Uncharacterized protein n=1 Tax=Nelumbo nucifera TaxID=4432 RepID=A0A822ZJT3_NELNU|nr:TPA_asm: hypothetical protein HUJ06_003348 [Nelumbo nucifera]